MGVRLHSNKSHCCRYRCPLVECAKFYYGYLIKFKYILLLFRLVHHILFLPAHCLLKTAQIPYSQIGRALSPIHLCSCHYSPFHLPKTFVIHLRNLFALRRSPSTVVIKQYLLLSLPITGRMILLSLPYTAL